MFDTASLHPDIDALIARLDGLLTDARAANAGDRKDLAYCARLTVECAAYETKASEGVEAVKAKLAQIGLEIERARADKTRVSFHYILAPPKDDPEIAALRAQLQDQERALVIAKAVLAEAQYKSVGPGSYSRTLQDQIDARAQTIEDAGPVFAKIKNFYRLALHDAVARAISPFEPSLGEVSKIAEGCDAWQFVNRLSYNSFPGTEENLEAALLVLKRARRGEPHLGIDSIAENVNTRDPDAALVAA